MRILGIVLGVILLFPGACSLFFMVLILPDAFRHSSSAGDAASFATLWAVCLLISLGGVVLIVIAARGPQRRDPPA